MAFFVLFLPRLVGVLFLSHPLLVGAVTSVHPNLTMKPSLSFAALYAL